MKLVKKITGFLIVSLLICITIDAAAFDPRNLLQKKATVNELLSMLSNKSEWIKYPAYQDRKGWDAYTGNLKLKLIQDGEKNLNYTWKVIKATDYLEFEKSGNRTIMENPFGQNNNALSSLLYAELAEGKGRFMNQIINGIWHTCEMSTWVLSAHLPVQKSKRSLPDIKEEIIDLTSGDLGSFLSWTWYFMHDELNKVNPSIAAKLKSNIQQRILVPYMARDDYWWQALNYKPGMMVNNWNPWCNFNVLTCFLLLEENPANLAKAVYKTMRSTDQFINYVKEDGACEEGPSYWGHAAGKMYDYLQLLHDATKGKLSIFDEPIVKNMGEYIARSYVGNGWVVNFADASAKGGGNPGLIFRYGKAVNSNGMQSFANYLLGGKTQWTDINESRDFFRTMENIKTASDIFSVKPSHLSEKFSWYPNTEFCYMKNNNNFFFAAKGGYNNESHNHNDVGTFSLYIDTLPVFIDAGVGTYTRQTFSDERYTIWTMQSDYHNLPMINGMPQKFGAEYKSANVKFDEAHSEFSMNIANAYTKETAVVDWNRKYTLTEKSLFIEDQFELNALKSPNKIHFMTWAKPVIANNGVVILQKSGKQVNMKYDASIFDLQIEPVILSDTRLSNVWGSEIYRMVFTAKKQTLKGKYKFTISKAE
jgi:hypothetical protein